MTHKQVEGPLYVLPGVTPGIQVELYHDGVHLHRGDLLSTLFGHEHAFGFGEITAIHLYESRHTNQGLFVAEGQDNQRLFELHYAAENHKLAEAIKAEIEARQPAAE